MHLGGVLVLIGCVLVALAMVTGYPYPGRRQVPAHAHSLLAVGTLLIGVGVLIGRTVLTT